ncbi:MAG: DUF5715 family protein [Bacteroidales bacterium]|nr:DUF5715 family protein [Bacteroidales bacterium]
MMYRRHIVQQQQRHRRRHRTSMAVALLALLALSATLYAFARAKGPQPSSPHWPHLRPASRTAVTVQQHVDQTDMVLRNRLKRDQIPPLSLASTTYRQLFDDSNYVQLHTARLVGIDPATVGNPASCEALVPIFSTDLYRVDTMYHAEPYLLPEATLLLHYIALRFNELMDEHHPDKGHYRIIVTSALRTEASERRLRRVNRNATDTSCHMFGTTFDISAQRYEHPSGSDTVVDFCKEMLARALYELRYEGLCYVKYERSSCFHITLRTTQYEGSLPSEQVSYCSPGSPSYLLTKAPERPPYSAFNPPEKKKDNKHENKKISTTASSNTSSSTRQRRKAGATATKAADNARPQPPVLHNQPITERERMSLDNYERNY